MAEKTIAPMPEKKSWISGDSVVMRLGAYGTADDGSGVVEMCLDDSESAVYFADSTTTMRAIGLAMVRFADDMDAYIEARKQVAP